MQRYDSGIAVCEFLRDFICVVEHVLRKFSRAYRRSVAVAVVAVRFRVTHILNFTFILYIYNIKFHFDFWVSFILTATTATATQE